MIVEHICERLKNVRPLRDGFTARCPGHDDRSNSLSIRVGAGKVLLHCFAGCTVETVCDALGIKVRDLFASDSRESTTKSAIVRRAEAEIRDLRLRLTPRERVLSVTVVYVDTKNLEAGMARALALAVEGEIVQCVLEGA
jgi:hypothetical protein